MKNLDDTDKNEISETSESIESKIKRLKGHLTELKAIESEINTGPNNQVSLTDLDARTMKSSSIGRTIGYNVQTAVDTKYHLIVAHYVTNAAIDRHQLFEIGKHAQDVLGHKKITVIADKGYYNGSEIKKLSG